MFVIVLQTLVRLHRALVPQPFIDGQSVVILMPEVLTHHIARLFRMHRVFVFLEVLPLVSKVQGRATTYLPIVTVPSKQLPVLRHGK